MRKTLILVLFSCLCLLSPAGVKADNFGVTGGVSLMSLKNVDMKSSAGYHAGLAYKFKLPVGFAVQPSLLYHSKAVGSEGEILNAGIKVGYIELPVSFQWGPDLLLFRPFVDVAPFVGYALTNAVSMNVFGPDGGQVSLTRNSWDNWNRFEYGLGLGGGIEVWKFQFVCRYNWNFGPLMNAEGSIGSQSRQRQTLKSMNFGGVTLSLALLF